MKSPTALTLNWDKGSPESPSASSAKSREELANLCPRSLSFGRGVGLRLLLRELLLGCRPIGHRPRGTLRNHAPATRGTWAEANVKHTQRIGRPGHQPKHSIGVFTLTPGLAHPPARFIPVACCNSTTSPTLALGSPHESQRSILQNGRSACRYH